MNYWFETPEELQAAVETLRGLGTHAQKLLAECVEHQGVNRTKASKSALALEDAGFCFIDELSIFDASVRIRPSLYGEEALEGLENISCA